MANKQTYKQANQRYHKRNLLAEVIIIRALGTLLKALKRNLEKLGADVALGLLQKSVVLETAHVIRRVIDSKGGRTQPREPTL